jgi:PilZ domain
MKPVSRWFEWLSSRERRRAKRQDSPHLVAHYWDGAAPSAHEVRDISSTGLYLLTDERWYPGTVVTMSLQKADAADTDPDRSIMVNAKVVRSGADGVGLSLILPEKPPSSGTGSFGISGADRRSFRRFLDRLMGNRVDEEYLAGREGYEADSLIPGATESDQP